MSNSFGGALQTVRYDESPM